MAVQEGRTKFCRGCGTQVQTNAFTCTSCGILLAESDDSLMPAVALALGFFFPGAGQLFYRRTVLGVILLAATFMTFYLGWIITMPISTAITASDAFAPKMSKPR